MTKFAYDPTTLSYTVNDTILVYEDTSRNKIELASSEWSLLQDQDRNVVNLSAILMSIFLGKEDIHRLTAFEVFEIRDGLYVKGRNGVSASIANLVAKMTLVDYTPIVLLKFRTWQMRSNTYEDSLDVLLSVLNYCREKLDQWNMK